MNERPKRAVDRSVGYGITRELYGWKRQQFRDSEGVTHAGWMDTGRQHVAMRNKSMWWVFSTDDLDTPLACAMTLKMLVWWFESGTYLKHPPHVEVCDG